MSKAAVAAASELVLSLSSSASLSDLSLITLNQFLVGRHNRQHCASRLPPGGGH